LFDARLEILPPAQRALWAELSQIPSSFVLYGGTAIALRLGHRQSEDFDFFSNEAFQPNALLQSLSFLKEARINQRGDNTPTVVVLRGGPVKRSFFGSVGMNHVREPDVLAEHGLQIASLLDLIATKLKTIQQGAEAKDYRDVAAALNFGLDLGEALAAARAIYGPTFNAMTTLKALTYFADGNLPTLAATVQTQLRNAAEKMSGSSDSRQSFLFQE
jgi:hypothetical protein